MKYLNNLFKNFLTIFIVLFSLFPVLWLLKTSISTKLEAFKIPPSLIFDVTFQNYIDVLNTNNFLFSLLNSSIISFITTVITLFLCIPSGYLLARSQNNLIKSISIWVVLSRMVPPLGFIIPFYAIMNDLSLLNTFTGVVLAYLTITLPLGLWIMQGFMKTIPYSIEEAAMIDGCPKFKIIIYIIIPLALPGIATIAILSFILSWNEFFYALILTGRNTTTATVMIQSFITFDGINWGKLAAAGVLITLPVLVFSMFVQNGLSKGLTSGAVK
jgi:multiple sugar transport system permease protein